MTPEMIVAAEELEQAAVRYRELYEVQNGSVPVVWVRRDEEGTAVFIADRFNTALLIKCLNTPPSIGDALPNVLIQGRAACGTSSEERAMLNDLLGTETETIDRLFLELSQFTKARTKREMQLNELLSAVSIVHPGETRFETALHYIRQAEAPSDCAQASGG